MCFVSGPLVCLVSGLLRIACFASAVLVSCFVSALINIAASLLSVPLAARFLFVLPLVRFVDSVLLRLVACMLCLYCFALRLFCLFCSAAASRFLSLLLCLPCRFSRPIGFRFFRLLCLSLPVACFASVFLFAFLNFLLFACLSSLPPLDLCPSSLVLSFLQISFVPCFPSISCVPCFLSISSVPCFLSFPSGPCFLSIQ